jgi:hypothetical protein
MNRVNLTSLILRIGLAFSFLYAAIAAYFRPDDWIGYFPTFLREIFSNDLLLSGWGFFEIIIAVWLLSGKRIFIPSVVAALSLAGLILTNLGGFDVIFRDVTIMACALALAVLHFPSQNDTPRPPRN